MSKEEQDKLMKDLDTFLTKRTRPTANQLIHRYQQEDARIKNSPILDITGHNRSLSQTIVFDDERKPYPKDRDRPRSKSLSHV